jgi:hypothetical protein
VQQRADDARHPVPRVSFLGELTRARWRERVEPGFAIGFRGAPIHAEQATLLQPDQRRIQRACRTSALDRAALLDTPMEYHCEH